MMCKHHNYFLLQLAQWIKIILREKHREIKGSISGYFTLLTSSLIITNAVGLPRALLKLPYYITSTLALNTLRTTSTEISAPVSQISINPIKGVTADNPLNLVRNV